MGKSSDLGEEGDHVKSKTLWCPDGTFSPKEVPLWDSGERVGPGYRNLGVRASLTLRVRRTRGRF